MNPTPLRDREATVYRLGVGDTYYFGSTTDYERRVINHLGDLKRGCHNSPGLQAAWNAHRTYTATLIAIVPDRKTGYALEQAYLDEYIRDEKCANRSTCAAGYASRRKFEEKDIIQIRSAWAAGESQSSIARRRGCTQANISAIVLRKTWTEVAA